MTHEIEKLPDAYKSLTPGPWFVAEGGVCAVDCPEDGANVICCEPERLMKASLARWPQHSRAIAAIPDMIAALAVFANCADEIDAAESEEEWAKFRLLVRHYRAARAALDKALGAQPIEQGEATTPPVASALPGAGVSSPIASAPGTCRAP